MSISELYAAAKSYAEKIMMEQPNFFSAAGSVCLIRTENDDIISGVSGIRIFDSRIEIVPAELNAAAYLVAEKKKKAVQMIIISFHDYSVCMPSEKSLNILLRAGAENSDCLIAVSPDETRSLSAIKEEYVASGKDKQDIPEEFLSGFDFGGSDDSNEPEEAPAANAQPVQPEQPAAQPQQNYANTFPQQQYQQQAYMQQPAAFPQQQYMQQPAGAEYQQQYIQQPVDPNYQQQMTGQAEYQQQYMQQPYQQQYMQQPYQQQYMQQPYQQQYMQQPYQQQYMQQPYQQQYMQQPYQQQSVYL
ncbi:MAG: hypothetical protein MR434_07010, partial [Ruminococcus sp.]|nr:hypothetical protein [Ruminococcus sp.]